MSFHHAPFPTCTYVLVKQRARVTSWSSQQCLVAICTLTCYGQELTMAFCLPQSGWEGTWKGGERVALQSPPGRGPMRHNLATHEASSPSSPGLSISLGLGALMIPGNNEKCLLNSRNYIYIYIYIYINTYTHIYITYI